MINKEETLQKLAEEIKNCKKCELYKTRTNPVPGEGNPNTSILLIGEAPGYWEDIKGKPFVGAAGKFLNELLAISRLEREDVYICNILKCRPTFEGKNRPPKPEEIKACTPYLDKQIKIIGPKIICTLGNFATSYILQKFGFKPESVGEVHGKVFEVNSLMGKMKIIPLYHPAAGLHKPPMKEIIRKDWERVKEEIETGKN